MKSAQNYLGVSTEYPYLGTVAVVAGAETRGLELRTGVCPCAFLAAAVEVHLTIYFRIQQLSSPEGCPPFTFFIRCLLALGKQLAPVSTVLFTLSSNPL